MSQLQAETRLARAPPRQVSHHRIDVLIADDHALILDIIAVILDSTADIRLRTALNVSAAQAELQQHGRFDLILLDLDMPGMQGADTLLEFIALNQGGPVGIITGGPSREVVTALHAKGAAGVVPKTTSLRGLTSAIRMMAAGETFFPPDLFPGPLGLVALDTLSPDELALLRLMRSDMSQGDMAEKLDLAEVLIAAQVGTICRKLGAANRRQAVSAARQMKLI